MLDAILKDDPDGRVACETLVNTGLILVSGEISATAYVDIPRIAFEPRPSGLFRASRSTTT